MIKSTFDLEKSLSEGKYDFIIGTDEAGRGPLCGPVVSAAVLYKSGIFDIPEEKKDKFDLIRDSKALSEKQRKEIVDFIYDHFHVGVGLVDHETIDRINILEASFLSMKKSLTDLFTKIGHKKIVDEKIIVLLDGKKEIPNFSLHQKAIVNGDRYVKSISAASIIAKVTRDKILMEAHIKYPEYGFDRHKGYGTKLHMEMLEKYGLCEFHRRSFGPVERLVKKEKR